MCLYYYVVKIQLVEICLLVFMWIFFAGQAKALGIVSYTIPLGFFGGRASHISSFLSFQFPSLHITLDPISVVFTFRLSEPF